ncbi:MAG: cytochrome c oxidase subunit 3 [Bacteroidota bacterium]|nr:cytochrome c oxidase subunit 3 [Bacteroidota bacterium]
MKKQMIQKPIQEQEYTVHPLKFILWLIIVAAVMLFAGLTSAYIVKKIDGKAWLEFQLPSMFMVSTIVVILSSVTMWWSHRSAKRDEIQRVKMGLFATLLFALSFVGLQYMGWKQLVENNVYFTGFSVSASFVYVISGLHVLHILGGIIFLGILLAKTYRYEVHKKNMLSISLCSTYWHFVGLLWVYLYFFMTYA